MTVEQQADIAAVRSALDGTATALAFERIVTRLWEVTMRAANEPIERGQSRTPLHSAR